MEKLISPERIAEISQNINEMYEADQAMRERAHRNGGVIETEEDETLDARNTEQVKLIIQEIGWPQKSIFGKSIPLRVWLLVQHADHDVAFQEHCLELMKALPKEEIDEINMAYLEDRILVNQGKPQIWGTQFFGKGDNYGPRPIQDPATVDERRLAIGLDTLAEYKIRLLKKYK